MADIQILNLRPTVIGRRGYFSRFTTDCNSRFTTQKCLGGADSSPDEGASGPGAAGAAGDSATALATRADAMSWRKNLQLCHFQARPLGGLGGLPWGAHGNLWPNPGKLIRRVLSEERGGCCSPRPGCGYSGVTRRGTSQEEEEEEEEEESYSGAKEEEEEEEEEERV